MPTPDGKVTFEAGGRARVLQFTTNRLCLLEEKIGKTPLDIAVELEMNPRMATLRAMFWAGLGEGDMTLAGAGEVMDEIGRTQAVEYARQAFEAAFPTKEEGGEGEANPQPAAAG